ncbi:MAG: hypothetical protein M3458_14800 [Acidobacteriota bacterium]|nr:hypothetical protein [Acidobacteriota bacterium]
MPLIPTDAVAVEVLVRGLLVTKFSGITGLTHVYTHRLYIENDAEAGRVLGYKHPVSNRTEHRDNVEL